ncbi:MAG: hypothetical protein L0K86_00560 [Actinomycetia bacterium]|nr:hypothetical protein [Actinomycetes bacterium]
MRRAAAVRLSVSSLIAVVVLTAVAARGAPEPVTPVRASTPPTPPVVAAASAVPATTATSAPSPTTAPAPRPATATKRAKTSPVYRCEPDAAARFDDPARPNVITNKNCPGLNAAKEKAQRKYTEQQRAAEQSAVGEAALAACREQTGQTTQECQAQAARGEAS